MSDPTVRRPSRPWPVLLLTALLACSACDRRGTNHPAAELLAAGWIDAATVGEPTHADPERLAALADAGLRGRVLRLDRLLDLYDGARFAGDQDARESLWLALGGAATTRGIEASREVVLRLLDEAYAIEDLAAGQPGALTEAEQRFVADAIMLLSTDMFLPDTAESLITATLAYRVLTEDGHPRVADNARWRLYDHVRGVLEGAVEVGPQLRPEVLVHVLYAEREDISAWLDDVAPHARPPLPTPAEVWALLELHRDALAQIDRWQAVVAARAPREAALHDTVLALLPRPRETGWKLAQMPRGTGSAESLAPVVLLEPGALQVEPSSTAPRSFDPRATDSGVIPAIEALLARDGRGTILLASAPDVPAPEYAAALRALEAARTSTIELGIHEPGLPLDDPGEGGEASERESVVVALPLYIARADDAGAGTRALRDSRIHVQLGGRGPRFRVDGRWLSATAVLPSDLATFIEGLHRAYPRQHTVSLALGEDVQHQQLVDLLAALAGGRTPAFVAVGWMPEVELAREPPVDAAADAALAARLGLGPEDVVLELPAQPPAGVPEPEWTRITQVTRALTPCVPELETALPKQGVRLALEFAERELVQVRASGRRVAKDRLEAFERCADDRLAGFTLREHEGPVSAELVVRAAPAK